GRAHRNPQPITRRLRPVPSHRTIGVEDAAVTAKVETGSLTELFHDLVQDAMQQQQIASSETTECYLVHLLERFASPGRSDLLDPPLGVDYLRAFELPALQRFDTLRRVADTAL